ncbi:hypothetical protein PGIGA_G00057660 [Pangasianodon gigas]|uniref:Uncharacterized protein n=1 Tax=Pangasianodon gigas TaxID=30993 RepID=A0ACC5X4I8_PANGG|nr:hypothetical protein [Pangasianodon gigas]
MSKPEATVARKNSLRVHEEETLRGARLRRESILIWNYISQDSNQLLASYHLLDAEADVSSFFASKPFSTSNLRFVTNCLLIRVSNRENHEFGARFKRGETESLPKILFGWLCLPPFPLAEQPQIKIYVKRSALGLLLWVAVLTTWITVFQHFRAQWGEVADYLSFTIPLGTP